MRLALAGSVRACRLVSPKMSSVVANPFNLDGEHSVMEMLLSAVFDGSYSQNEKTLVADNGTIEYTYTKGPIGNKMTVRVLSLLKPRPKFVVRFAPNQQPFSISMRLVDHPMLDLSACVPRVHPEVTK